MNKLAISTIAAMSLSASFGSAALAQTIGGRAGAVAAVAAVAPSDEAFASSTAMTESELGKVAGREDTGAMTASATQRNTVANNSVVGTSTTGNVQIDGNAFQNLQGLAVISANSGNNVAINSAMNVVVNLAPR